MEDVGVAALVVDDDAHAHDGLRFVVLAEGGCGRRGEDDGRAIESSGPASAVCSPTSPPSIQTARA